MAVDTRARWWFAVTALVVIVGIVIQVQVAIDNTAGVFDTPTKRAFNVFAFFTIQSNIIVAATTAALAAGRAPSSTVGRVLRLTGVVAITVTFVVYHLLLSELQVLTGAAALANLLLHTASPILCVSGWLLFGPRHQTTPRVAALALVFLAAWGVFTLIRGAITGWYPYPFMDPGPLGYGRMTVNLIFISAGFAAVAFGAHWLDRRLPSPVPTPTPAT